MKLSSICVNTLKELLEKEGEKGEQVRNLDNESYQEYRFHNLTYLRKDMLESLYHLVQKAEPKSLAFSNFVQPGKKNQCTIITFCRHITDIFQHQKLLTLSHKYSHSQSILISTYLATQLQTKVHVLTKDCQLRGVGHLISEENEADRLGFTKETASKEGVSLHDIESWQEHTWIQPDSVVVLDLFGLNPVEYRPFLLRYSKQLKSVKKLFIYHSHLQDCEVGDQLQGAEGLDEGLTLQLWPEHPLETFVEKDQKALLQRLIEFLKEDSERPEKQDVVIFIPADSHTKRFAAKFGEQLSKERIREQVNILTKANQPQSKGKNNIFLTTSARELAEWDYDYGSLFYAADFQTETHFLFDYALGVFVQKTAKSSGLERARRVAMVGSARIGRYACISTEVTPNLHYTDSFCELSSYVLRMAEFGVSSRLEFGTKRVAGCLAFMESLGIVKKEGQEVKVLDRRVLEAAQAGVSPIQTKIILNVLADQSLNPDQRRRLANLLLMMLVVIHSEGTLRQGKQELDQMSNIKPNGVWRKSGYLQSCLQILTKYELIENRKAEMNIKSESFRRKTSKFNQYQYEVFGCLYETCQPKKKTFEDMTEEQFLRDCTINQDLFMRVRDQVDEIRTILQVRQLNIIFSPDDLHSVLKYSLNHNQAALAVYSGSRREGYRLSNQLSAFTDKRSLMSQLNQRPEFLLTLRLSCYQRGFQILMGNAVSTDNYLSVFGKLPVRRQQSLSEIEIQFHGISSSTFEELWKNNGKAVVKLEQEMGCLVEPNQEMAMVIIHCRKEDQENIRSTFETLLGRIRQKLSLSNKLVHYLGNTNVLLGSGGAVQEIIQTGYIDKCLLGNLHLQISKEDLLDLFEDLVPVKDVEINNPEIGKYFKSAMICFNSQRDYYRFHECFHECLYYERVLDVKPLLEDNSNRIVKAKQYIQFKWYVWKSHRKALVRFTNGEAALKAFKELQQYPTLDGAQITMSCQENQLMIDQLSIHTDEICIEEAMRGFGEVKQVEILKTPLKEVSSEDVYLENLIKEILQRPKKVPQQNQEVKYKMEPIIKAKSGLRQCRVHFPNAEGMNLIAKELNRTIGKLGESRLYAQTWFQTPVAVPLGSMSIYQQLYGQVMEEANNPNISHYIQENNNKTYLILRCPIKQTLDVFHQRLMNSLTGYPILLSEYQKTIILSEIGLANLFDLEEKYHCKLIVDEIKRSLHALASINRINSIKAEISSRVEDHFFYRLSLNRHAFKHFQGNAERLKEIQSSYNLRLLELQTDTMALLLEGSALNVQKAFNFLMHFIESLTVTDQDSRKNPDVCGICCQEPHRPYRFQNCSHKFCRSCLIEYINSVLGDNSLFPIKCPQCGGQVIIDDLDSLLQPGQWNKALTMAMNQYVTKRGDSLTFCFNAGCKQVTPIKGDHISCDVCLGQFCILCKAKYHPGLSCAQAKQGGDSLFKKYMEQNGVRRCPNKNCGIPVIRYDGCYRVTCSRCNISMCFKCPADKMTAYPNYNDCYKHLSQVHGGYF